MRERTDWERGRESKPQMGADKKELATKRHKMHKREQVHVVETRRRK
jgi:hypothetical protein